MATTTLPAKNERLGKDRSATKPLRAMTHPLREPPANAAKKQQRVKQGEPFDPDELTRRLQVHLIQQKQRAQRRRAERAAKEAAAALPPPTQETTQHPPPKYALPGQDNVYHHVPKVAASAFARTTTPDPMRQIHALSQPAVRTHLEQLTLDDATQPLKGLKKTQAMDQAVAEREMLRSRNQFQRDHLMESAAEMDTYRDIYKPQQRTFMGEGSHLKPRQEKNSSRPLSTGDMPEEKEPLSTTKTKRRSKPNGFDMTERNNWTQEDEVPELKSSKKDKEKEREKEKDKATTIVRKKPSSWILLGKRSPKPDKEKDEAVAGVGEAGSPPPDGSKGKGGFLARFKRHPS